MLDQAFEALTKMEWGSDPKVLQPIDDAIIASHGDDAARAKLEQRLLAILDGGTEAGRDFVFRKLRVIGTAASVPALAKLLGDARISHMARYALESMPSKEAGAALRNALDQVQGKPLVGVISSVGARRDAESAGVLTKLVKADDAGVANAAAVALGRIGSVAAAKALAEATCDNANDASLACAEHLLASNQRAAALGIYKRLSKSPQKHVKLAATRGLLKSVQR